MLVRRAVIDDMLLFRTSFKLRGQELAPTHFRSEAPSLPPPTLTRRSLVRASAAFAAMVGASAVGPARARAQQTPTHTGEWEQPAAETGPEAVRSFTTDFPFHAIAPHWSSETVVPVAVELWLSSDGVNFSDPVIVGPAAVDAGPNDREGRVFGDLLSTEPATTVRYRGLDADGVTTVIPGLSFTYIDATGGPTLADITASSLDPAFPAPPIITRSDWGAELAYGGSDRGAQEWTPQYQTVRHVIIHHSENPSFRDPLAEIRSIHYYHAVTRGWGDIGYNYLVDYLGNVYEGRIGGENVIGGHAYRYGQGSAGICAMGSFSFQTSTPEALAGLTWITAWASRLLDPLAQADFHDTPNLPTICAHRDVNESTCPGDGLYAELDAIRGAVAEVIAGNREVFSEPLYSPGEPVAVNVEDTNLRAAPGTGSDVTATVALGTLFHIIEGPTTVDERQWFHVAGDNGEGWIASELVASSNAIPPAGNYRIGDALAVDTDFMNIRAEPTIRASIVATIPYDEPVTVVEGPRPSSGHRWYLLSTAYGSGWGVERYLVPPDSREPESRFTIGDPIAVDDPIGLRLRTEASLESPVVTSLPIGTIGTVIDGPKLNDRVTWVKIQTTLGSGWCAELYLVDAPALNIANARFLVGDSVFVDTDALNIREAPGPDTLVAGTLGTGTTGTIIDGPEEASNLFWFRIETPSITGWCAEPFLSLAGTVPVQQFPIVGDTVFVNTDGINLRTAPGMSTDVAAILLQGETGTVTEAAIEADGSSWIALQTSRGDGWAAVQYLGVGPPDPTNPGKFAVGDVIAVDTDGINVRTDPTPRAAVARILLADERATIVDGPRDVAGFTWFKIMSSDNEGWAVDRYLRLATAAGLAPGSTARVTDGELNLRSDATSASDVLAILPDGAYVDVVDGPVPTGEEPWFKVRSSRFGTGWCSGDFLVRA